MRRLVLAALAFAATAAVAAEAPVRQLYAVHQEIVKPSQLAAYESTSKEFIAFVEANRAAMKDFSSITLQGEDFVYTWAAPIASFAGVDAINGDFAAVFAGPVGAQAADLFARNSATLDSIREWVVARRADLSYAPTAPRLKDDQMKFVHYDFYYLQPGQEETAEAIARDFVALFRKKNWPDGYSIFMSAMGPDTPLLMVEVPDTSAASYYERNEAMRAAMGAEGQALFARAFAITRRFESHNGWLRPDLSVPPVR